jgi:hypothetical protein
MRVRRIRIKKKSKRKIRIKRRIAPRRVTASRARVRVRKPRRGESLPKASRTLRPKPRKGRKIVVRNRRRFTSSRSAAKRSERLKREINVFGAEGYQPIADASPRQTKLSSRHLIAINKFLRTGDTKPLKQFRGKRIGGIELLTEPKRIRDFADVDLVKLDGLYRDQRGHGRRK